MGLAELLEAWKQANQAPVGFKGTDEVKLAKYGYGGYDV
ncbi:hypothetical protein MTJW_06600 [Moorella thermoacetica]|nr:hypothetical protein MTJW_06600 [Moorella thermoacetica]